MAWLAVLVPIGFILAICAGMSSMKTGLKPIDPDDYPPEDEWM